MKLKLILSTAVMAGATFTGFADGYLDGVEYYQVGQDDNAKIVLDQTLNESATKKAVAYYYLGNIALNKCDKATASKYFDLGLKSDASYAFNLVGQGAVALKSNNADAAKDLFKQADKLGKKDAQLKVAIARAFYSTDSILYKKEFNNYLKDAKKANKQEASIYIFEGDMFADQKDYGKSAGYYEMAISYDQDRPIAYVKYANTYFHIAPEVAIEKLKIIADKLPNSLLAQRELAEKYYENNQWTIAADQYGKVINNPNHFADDESRYAVLLYFGERYDESIAQAEQVLAKGHKPFLMKRMLFLNKAAMKDYEGAATAAEDFFKMQETDGYTFTANDYATYGDVLINLERYTDAIPQFENALKVNPKGVDNYRNLSTAYNNAAIKSGNDPDLYLKAAESYQKYIDGSEYGKDYDLQDLFVLTARYQNVLATSKNQAQKDEAYKNGSETLEHILSKAEANYLIVQRKARMIRAYYGEDVRRPEAVEAYQKCMDMAEADSDISETKKNNVIFESCMYIGTYILLDKKDTPSAKKYFEKAYKANPQPAIRQYIDGLK